MHWKIRDTMNTMRMEIDVTVIVASRIKTERSTGFYASHLRYEHVIASR